MSAFIERRYQVFISSTSRDLKEEREKALQAVLKVSAFPVGMEMFPSADDEQFEFIKREIESSDYYIVIVAGKYGSIAPDGVSYTEKEYDYAVSLKKPVIGFVVESLDDLKGSQLEPDDEGRQKLQAFRDKVRRNKLAQAYRNPDHLQMLVMQALNHAFRSRPQEGWVRAANARRMEDLEELNELQKRVRQLETENTALKAQQADPRAGFSQGEDLIEWDVLLDVAGEEPPAFPPSRDFQLRTTWNELLIVIFPLGIHHTGQSQARERVWQFAFKKVKESYPNDKVWVEAARTSVKSIDTQGMLLWGLSQFVGLGLVDAQNKPVATSRVGGAVYADVWSLTEEGRLRQLQLLGLKKNSPALSDDKP